MAEGYEYAGVLMIFLGFIIALASLSNFLGTLIGIAMSIIGAIMILIGWKKNGTTATLYIGGIIIFLLIIIEVLSSGLERTLEGL